MLHGPHVISYLGTPMSNRGNHIDQLHDELGMLKTAYELFTDPPSQRHILARVLTCVTEYTQLVDGQLSAVIETTVVEHDGAEDNV
jgi:hypothetical protein